MKGLKVIADRIAKRHHTAAMQEAWSWADIRDECDGETYSDLDCIQLDILTDMVVARLEKVSGRPARAFS